MTGDIKQIHRHFEKHQQAMAQVAEGLSATIAETAGVIAAALGKGGKILVMGNGGSAADAQHLAAEMVGRFLLERRALPAIALTTDTSILTAVGNDYGFDEVFKRQVEALAVPGDIVVGISTSGCSNNVFQALMAANSMGCKTIGLLGRDGGNIGGIVDLNLTVPVMETPHIQEAHVAIIHILCDLVEKTLFPPPETGR
ncbi:MAG TPA: D-sedoheptulose 7-phosphate isomerase [Desulfuromonadales bacterium]|jgi:D-sedoheptulose 7-phosphate isomerase